MVSVPEGRQRTHTPMADSIESEEDTDPDARANELLKDLFDFISHSDRILFVQNIDTWKGFHSASENARNYNHISPDELRELFLNDLLPCLDIIEIPVKVKKRFKVLDFHPQFKRSEEGYTRLPATERIGGQQPAATFLHDPENQSDSDMKFRPDKEKLRKPFVLEECLGGGDASKTSHIKVFDASVQHANTHFRISPANAALLSAVLATNNQELVSCALIDPSKVHGRLQSAKYKFENTGQLLPYLNAEQLINQVGRIKKLHEALINILSKRFFYK